MKNAKVKSAKSAQKTVQKEEKLQLELSRCTVEDFVNAAAKKHSTGDYHGDTLLVFATQKPAPKKRGAADAGEESKPAKLAAIENAPRGIKEKLAHALENGSITGDLHECTFLRHADLGGFHHVMILGLGEVKDLDHEGFRRAMGSAVAQLKVAKSKDVVIALDTIPKVPEFSVEQITATTAEAVTLAMYSFDDLKSKPATKAPAAFHVLTVNRAKGLDTSFAEGITLGECTNFARWLGDQPGNKMTPTILADETAKAARGTKLKVNVWDRAKIKAENMGSFLSVSFGSSQDPRFITMEYRGAAATKKPVCFVGKGLTFDSGGISIKPSAGMEEMKYDMCGGAAVIGTMLAIAKLGLNVNAIAFVPATENMPGPAANKPGDIVTARNGKTIEVNNTDAEGRLILNDALVYACEQDPQWICDAATLTGAMVVALGNIHTGIFTRHDKFAEKIQKAARASGELVWRMPLTDFHVKDMKGTYADLSNISSGKGAGSATAAGFLEQFVKDGIPWAHFDVAGTAWNSGDRFSYNPKKGATGVMVRTFVHLAMLSQ